MGVHKTVVLIIGCILATVVVCQKPRYMPLRSHLLELSDSRKTGVEGAQIRVTCTAHVSAPHTLDSLRWMSRHNGRSEIIQTHPDNITVIMTIRSLHGSDAGRYACVLIMADGREETAEFELHVKRREPNSAACSITQFKCKKTKYCIFLRYRCDGKDDCGDNSDEDCAIDPCNNKFRCNNSRCVDLEDLCNHVDNCGDKSDEGNFCSDKPSSTSQPVSEENQFGWLKITVIASTVGLVILISFIVIMVYRVKMRRLREQRIARALERMYHHGGSGEPTSSGHGDEGPSDQHPFLPSTSQRHYGNIIVNVNNGVQYMPGYEYSLFMDAPPPYSEVGKTETGESNAPPPPYSTLDRNTAQRLRRENADMDGDEVHDLDMDTPARGVSQFSVQNCLGSLRSPDRSGGVIHTQNEAASGDSAGNSASGTAGDNSRINTGTLPGISINSRFLQSLLGSHGQGSATNTLSATHSRGEGQAMELSETGLMRGDITSDSQLSNPISAGVGSGHGPIVNITNLNSSPHRHNPSSAPVVASHGTQTPRHRVHATGQGNTTSRDQDGRQGQQASASLPTDPSNSAPEASDRNSNSVTQASPVRSGSTQENMNASSAQAVASEPSHSPQLNRTPVTVDTAEDDVSSLGDGDVISNNRTMPSAGNDSFDFGDNLSEILDQAGSAEDETSGDPLLASCGQAMALPAEDGTCLLRRHRSRGESEGSFGNDSDVLMPLTPSRMNSHEGEAASNALLTEVSRRDERNRPRPGHLSVQGGQILLHTNDGVLANDCVPSSTTQPTSGVRSDTGQPLAGELVVRDGHIMLQPPRSGERSQDRARPSSLVDDSDHSGSNVSSLRSNNSQVLRSDVEITNGSGAAQISSPPQSSTNQSSNMHGATVNNGSNNKASTSDIKDGEGAARLSGELNIKDGCLVLEPPKHTPSSQILSHLQNAYAAEQGEKEGNQEEEEDVLEPVVNTKRPAGIVTRPPLPKFNNTDIVLPFKNQQ